ncbi:MAG: XdhC family protein [Woeseiaceae bacterium]|nr:XdhC family protein [Woeseiaceae bacterium]
MHFQKIQAFFNARRERGQDLVMATVIATEGSTYSKSGERMLIDDNGIFQGMLSGGCLEGDLAIRAQQVLESGKPDVVAYNLADDDELWGLGVGCDGMMRVLLQPLSAATDYQPFARLAELAVSRSQSAAALVVASTVDGLRAGASCLVHGDDVSLSGSIGRHAGLLQEHCGKIMKTRFAGIERHRVAGKHADVFYATIEPVPRLLVLGAGLDAEPLVRIAAELGWLCTVSDHRPAYVESNSFDGAEAVVCCPADEVSATLSLDDFDLAIVMSHHLSSDRSYLRQLATTSVPYIGLLGPPGRRERLVAELGDEGGKLDGRLHGPAGLDLGGRGPAAIALSITAEMQQALSRVGIRPGNSRTGSNE